jgi:hypothetical protein
MKRYLVFAGECYYACGGANDFIAAFEDLDEATKRAKWEETENERGIPEEEKKESDWPPRRPNEWSHVFDLLTQKVVYRSQSHPHGGE